MNSEVPVNSQGVVYHIQATERDIADKIILVGDPGRVPMAAELFDAGSLTFDHVHREIRTMTGAYKGERMTVMSSGMGTDNMEIIINELHALKEYDPHLQQWKSPKPLTLIRVGTCGTPQEDIALGTLVISNHIIGLDNTCQYYVCDKTPSVRELERRVNQTVLSQVGVYATQAHQDVVHSLVEATKKNAPGRPYVVGITATASGFFACQGRAVGRFASHMRFPDLVEILAKIELPPERVVNLEMESSSLCFLSNLLGYKAGTICVVVAARSDNQRKLASSKQAQEAMRDALKVAFEALSRSQ